MITFKFSKFFDLKPNILKCKVAGMGSLERFKATVCLVVCRVVSCIDLATETLILGMGGCRNFEKGGQGERAEY